MKTEITQHGTQIINHSGATTDAEFVRLFLRNKGRNSDHTLRAYTRTVDGFVMFAAKPLAEVTVSDLEAYRDILEDQYDSVYSRNQRLSIVRSLLSFGQSSGYLQFNVGAAVNLEKTPDTLSERIISESDTFRLFEAAANDRERLILRTLYYSACRVDELCRLCWKHLSGLVLTIHGKGGKTRYITLLDWLVADIVETRGDTFDLDDPIFPRPRSGKPMIQVDVYRMIRRAGDNAGIKGVSPHWLRHAHASHSLDRGATIAVVKETLGHSNIAVTGRYAHTKPGESSALYLPE